MNTPRRNPTVGFGKGPTPPSTLTYLPTIPMGQAPSLASILPQELRTEQSTMLSQKFGEVTTGVQQLCFIANRLGRRYGVHGEAFEFDRPTLRNDAPAMEMVLFFMQDANRTNFGSKFFQITRTNKIDWTIFFGERPGLYAMAAGRASEPLVPVTESNIETKRLCLRHSAELFKRYLQQVTSTASDIDADLVAASRVIQELGNL